MGGETKTSGIPGAVRRGDHRQASRPVLLRRGLRQLGLQQLGLLQLGLAASVAAILWYVSRWVYPFGPPELNWLVLPVCPLLGIIVNARVARQQHQAAPARRMFGCLAYSSLMILFAVFSLTYDSLAGPGAPVQRCGPLSLALFFSAILIALWGALRLPIRKRSRREWVTIGLDIGIVLVACGLVLAYATTETPEPNSLVWLSIMMTAAIGVLVAIKVSLTGFTGIKPGAIRALAGAVLLGSIVGSVPQMAARPDLNNTMLTLPLAFAGLYIAAELQCRVSQSRRPVRRRRPLPFSVLPYVAIAFTDAILLIASRSSSAGTTMMIIGSVVITGLVIARQMIAFYDHRRFEDELAYRATHDELTGLVNRSLFAERVQQALITSPSGSVAVTVVDLDDFKSINERLGHTVGDALLVQVSARLRECIRPADTVARLGGDEFGILLANLEVGESTTVANRILSALTEPIRAAGHHLLTQASIGLADNDAKDAAGTTGAEDLLRRADIAMHAAKELGKNRYVHYDDEMEARTVEHAQLAAELSGALERGELYLVYQPIIDLRTGRMTGVESLVRWSHPRDGVIPPVKFIPVAERTGLIVPIGAWILRTACDQAADWQRRIGDHALEHLTVNVSARQLLEPAFADTVSAALHDSGLDPARLTVEITETAVFGGGRAIETVAAIRALGVAIALDDFGTGHSSLGLLQTCPVDVLKVDKSFVDVVTGAVGQVAITAAIIEIAAALGLRAIAEGVETGAQADRLHQLGYQFAQGYHFARPLPPLEVEQLMRDRDSDRDRDGDSDRDGDRDRDHAMVGISA
jgi:diguanylate cyclase (GGDEF)-like protein